MDISQTLHDLRLERGWSYMDLARRSGLSKGYLWSVEQHEASPGLDVVVKIANAFDLSASQFIEMTERRYVQPSSIIYQPFPYANNAWECQRCKWVFEAKLEAARHDRDFVWNE